MTLQNKTVLASLQQDRAREFMKVGGLKFAARMKQKDTSLKHWKLHSKRMQSIHKSTMVFSYIKKDNHKFLKLQQRIAIFTALQTSPHLTPVEVLNNIKNISPLCDSKVITLTSAHLEIVKDVNLK